MATTTPIPVVKTLPILQSFVFNFYGDGITSIASVTTALSDVQLLIGIASKNPSGIAYTNVVGGVAANGSVLSATSTITAAGVLTITFSSAPSSAQAVEVVVGVLF